MKKNKIIIYICIGLICLIFIQSIYFKKSEENEIIIPKAQIEEESEGIIFNIDDFYKYYSEINVSSEKIENAIYKFITEDLSIIMIETKENDATKNGQYYNENKIRFYNMGIRTKEDFILIAEDLKNSVKSDDARVRIVNTGFNEEYLNDEESYVFDLIVEFTNSANVVVQCKIKKDNIGKEKSKTNNVNDDELTIAFASNSDIAKIYKEYNGTVKIEDTIQAINKFQEKIKTIYDETTLKSINGLAKYYEEKKEELAEIGIVSEEDFKGLVYQIKNSVNWYQGDSYYYKFDITNQLDIADYVGYKLAFIYNYSDYLEVEFYLSKSINDIPKIIIKGTGGGI